MVNTFERKLRLVRLRCSANLLLEHTGRVLTLAGGIAVLALLTERLLALNAVNIWTIRGFAAAAAALVLALWLFNQPTRMQVSLLLDRRLKLRERFSTTLALADSQDPFATAARAEAYQTARQIDPQRQFPVRPSKQWAYFAGIWLSVVILAIFLPQKDLLGFLKSKHEQEKLANQTQSAKADVNDTTRAVKATIERLDKPELAEELAKLNEIPKDARPEDIKRQAIRQLGDLSDKLRQMQNDVKFDALTQMLQMFRQLPGSTEAFSQKLRLALAQGNFGQAAAMLKQMQQEMTEGKLTEQQQKTIAQQLQELARQIQDLAAKDKQLEEEMEKLGLDKGLARLSEQQLREALQKQGLGKEAIEQLLQKAAACRMARGRCSGLGRSVGACAAGGGLSSDELAAAAEQLDSLESLQQQMMLVQAALDQIAGACTGLGQGMCQGLGGQGPFAEGLAQNFGSGTGRPGRGYGAVQTDDKGTFATTSTKVDGQTKQGPVIASWYFKGSQEKGDSRRDLSEVLQAARDSAAEAISENQIPRKYEDAVKKYFGRLEQTAAP